MKHTLCLVTLVGMTVTIGSVAVAQHVHDASTRPKLPLAVDGAVEPHRVPDHVAYRHFVLAVVEPPQNTEAQHARRTASVERVGLAPGDVEALNISVKGAARQLSDLDQMLREAYRPGEDQSALALSIRTQREEVLDSVRARIFAALSPAGQEQVERHVREYVKGKIRIYGDPPLQ